jgi:hypothetical protein
MCIIAAVARHGQFAAIPEDSLIIRAIDVLFYAYAISVVRGVLIGCSQTWMLIRGLRTSRQIQLSLAESSRYQTGFHCRQSVHHLAERRV